MEVLLKLYFLFFIGTWGFVMYKLEYKEKLKLESYYLFCIFLFNIIIFDIYYLGIEKTVKIYDGFLIIPYISFNLAIILGIVYLIIIGIRKSFMFIKEKYKTTYINKINVIEKENQKYKKILKGGMSIATVGGELSLSESGTLSLVKEK